MTNRTKRIIIIIRTINAYQAEREVLNMQKQYITAEELQTIMGISRGKAYEIIRSCNQELKAQGFITIAGKLPIAYMEKKYYGFDINAVGGGENNG